MISLVLPAYNEVRRLENTIKVITKELRKLTEDFEIIIAEDGATDGTDKLAEKLAKEHSYIRHFHSDKRLGRGLALTRTFKKSHGDILLYSDVDLATSPVHISKLIKEIERGADVSTGSRRLKGSVTKRNIERRVLSKIYNFLVKLLLNSKIKDHQCGFKAFKRKTALSLLNETENTHWFWDTEILVRAQKKGLKVTEIPVRWYQIDKETKVKLLKDSIIMFLSIIKLMFKLRGKNGSNRLRLL